jgi:hypothetical protein
MASGQLFQQRLCLLQVTFVDCATGAPTATFPALHIYMRGGTMLDTGAPLLPPDTLLRSVGHGRFDWKHGESGEPMHSQHLNNPEEFNRLPETAWKPRFYCYASSEERKELEVLRKTGSVFRVLDTLRGQLEELLVGRRPAEKDTLTAKDRAALIDEPS